MPPKRKFAPWRTEPERKQAGIDRVGFITAFANPENKIIYDLKAPNGHELAIAVVSPQGVTGGVSLEEWRRNKYGVRTAIVKGLDLRACETGSAVVLPSHLVAARGSSMKICPHCGEQNRIVANYCFRCKNQLY